jgi:hypothetical protein
MKDVTGCEQLDTWLVGKEWQRERLKIGGEYISWPQQRELKEQRGRRCVFLGFVQAPYGKGTKARVSFKDNERVELVSPEDLVAAWLVGTPSKRADGDGVVHPAGRAD